MDSECECDTCRASLESEVKEYTRKLLCGCDYRVTENAVYLSPCKKHNATMDAEYKKLREEVEKLIEVAKSNVQYFGEIGGNYYYGRSEEAKYFEKRLSALLAKLSPLNS